MTARIKATDMCEVIESRLATSRHSDPELQSQLIRRTLTELRRAAEGEDQDALAIWARWLLTDLWHRADSGVPYGEPREPEYLEHDVLDADERGGR